MAKLVLTNDQFNDRIDSIKEGYLKMKIDKFLTLKNIDIRYEDNYENGFKRNFYFVYQGFRYSFEIFDGFKYDLASTICNNLKCLEKRTLGNFGIVTYYNRKFGYFVNDCVVRYQDFFTGDMVEIPVTLGTDDYRTLVSILIC